MSGAGEGDDGRDSLNMQATQQQNKMNKIDSFRAKMAAFPILLEIPSVKPVQE